MWNDAVFKKYVSFLHEDKCAALMYENISLLLTSICYKLRKMSKESVSTVPSPCNIFLTTSVIQQAALLSPQGILKNGGRKLVSIPLCLHSFSHQSISSSRIITGERGSHNIGPNPCVVAVATPETIWTASSKAKTRLWWTSSSRSTGKPNRRSSRSPGRKRTNMWWRQTQIWMASWRSAGLWKCWGL